MVTPGGIPYVQSAVVHLNVQGTVQVFKNVQPIVLPPREIDFMYIIF